jgi:hypothetical protein
MHLRNDMGILNPKSMSLGDLCEDSVNVVETAPLHSMNSGQTCKRCLTLVGRVNVGLPVALYPNWMASERRNKTDHASKKGKRQQKQQRCPQAFAHS